MKIIKKARKIIRTEWALEWEGPEGRGYRFDCDEYGVVETKRWEEEAFESYRLCITGKIKEQGYDGPFLNPREYKEWEPAEGICDECSKILYLSYATNHCCHIRRGRYLEEVKYNKSGQRLNPTRPFPRNEMEDA